MERQLIVNADDFCLDADVDEAILILAEKSCISSTTILSNLSTAAKLAELKKMPVSTGLHLNLIEGEPISKFSEIATLLGPTGNFKPAFTLLKDFMLGKISTAHIETEVRAQLKNLTRLGISISHVDSHQHIHQYPYLGNCLLKILRQQGVKKIRNCRLSEYKDLRMGVVMTFHQFVKNDNKKFTGPDLLIPSFSILRKAGMDVFETSLQHAFKSANTAEYMTHPGLKNDPNSYLNKKAEYDFWKDDPWKECLIKNHIQLISYNGLAGKA